MPLFNKSDSKTDPKSIQNPSIHPPTHPSTHPPNHPYTVKTVLSASPLMTALLLFLALYLSILKKSKGIKVFINILPTHKRNKYSVNAIISPTEGLLVHIFSHFKLDSSPFYF